MLAITPAQVQKIHVLKSKLQMSDENYRIMLSSFGVNTSKHLNLADAADLINKMETWAISRGVQRQRKYDEYGGRDGATPAQLRKIDVLWSQVSRQTNSRDRDAALRSFVKRITGIDDIRWLEHRHVSKIIKAIQSMPRLENNHGDHDGNREAGQAIC